MTELIFLQIGAILASSALALIPVDSVAVDGEPAPADAVMRIEQELNAAGVQVLSRKDVAERMSAHGFVTDVPTDVAETLRGAEAAYQAIDAERSVALLEEAIRALTMTTTMQPENVQVLEDVRVKAASRLMAVAGVDETGHGETPQGKRALVHLTDVLRANPTLALDAAKHPPKMRRLLDEARNEIQKGGSRGLSVDSSPSGATVYVEGRPLGLTPLKLVEALPRGRYRVWAEKDGARSLVRVVDIDAEDPTISIDLALEGAIRADGTLRPLRGQAVDDRMAAKMGAILDVENVVLVGVARFDDARWLYAAQFSVAEGRTSRRGAIRLDGKEPTPADIQSLAAFLRDGKTLDSRPVPPSILPSTERPGNATGLDNSDETIAHATSADDEGGLPWVMMGVGGAVVAVVVTAAVIGGGYVVYTLLTPPGTTTPKDDRGSFSVEVVK